MKRRRVLSISLAFILLLSSCVWAAEEWDYVTYENARFAYEVEYPDYLTQDGDLPVNGDGIRLAGEGATLTFWGSYNVLSQTPEDYLSMTTEGMVDVSTKRGDDYCQYSFTEGDEKTLQYVYFPSDSKILGFRITYPKSEKKAYKKILKQIKKSLRENTEAIG